MEVVIPCAGLSSRFPNLRPKYLLTDYSGKMMIEGAAKNYIGRYPITITILEEHNLKYNAKNLLKEVFGNLVRIISLPTPTSGPADTVYQTIKMAGIDRNSGLLIKDSDGFYDSEIIDGNGIYVCNLNKNPSIKNVHAKSYTITNQQQIIVSVVEKQIVSNNFCAGGYQFDNVSKFLESFETIKNSATSEIYVSNIIDYMISNGDVFIEQEVSNFYDVGTAPDWFEYNNRPTYFCDIDGTIVKNKHPSEEWEPIQENIDILLKEQQRDCKLIFATARLAKWEYRTRQMLDALGFTNYTLIMGVNHSRRVLINDFSASNPYPTAVAINLSRDSNNLTEFITS